MKKEFFHIVAIIVFLAACKKDTYETYVRVTENSYYNDTLGVYNIYKVNEIKFDDFTNTSDTFNYQLMEFNDTFFVDNLGRKALKVDRYKRISDTSLWVYINSCYSVLDINMLERVEDNKRMIKISFPITLDAVWNSNAYNLDNAINVFYGLINKPYTLDNFKFRKVISVESTIVNNSKFERSYKEIYASGYGLVFKNQVNIEKSNNGDLVRGFKINYRLLKHAR